MDKGLFVIGQVKSSQEEEEEEEEKGSRLSLPSVLEPDFDLLRVDVAERRAVTHEQEPLLQARFRALPVQPL